MKLSLTSKDIVLPQLFNQMIYMMQLFRYFYALRTMRLTLSAAYAMVSLSEFLDTSVISNQKGSSCLVIILAS